jgi:hypothetical protein
MNADQLNAEELRQRAHRLAGRMTGASGVVSFCTCGSAFFGEFVGEYAPGGFETAQQRRDARERADGRLSVHALLSGEAAVRDLQARSQPGGTTTVEGT